MSSAKIAITLDEQLLRRLDEIVAARQFPNRSRAIQAALEIQFERLDRSRLARECAKLDPAFEQELAEDGLAEDSKSWPAY